MSPRARRSAALPEPDDEPGCRSVNRALARDLVKRNVVGLCTVPQGCAGRRSKALTMAQAEGVLRTAEGTRMHSYIVLSLLTGARTEELRALTWDAVDLIGDPEANVPVPPHVAVWRSTRAGGDTKTRQSRRTLALSKRCVTALELQRSLQECDRAAAGWRSLARARARLRLKGRHSA